MKESGKSLSISKHKSVLSLSNDMKMNASFPKLPKFGGSDDGKHSPKSPSFNIGGLENEKLKLPL